MSDLIRRISNPNLHADVIAELERASAVLLDPDHLDIAIIGAHNGRAVYDYHMVVESYAQNMFDSSEDPLEDAVDWVNYNTVRALPYAGPLAPIVVFEVEEDDGSEDDDLHIGGKAYRAV